MGKQALGRKETRLFVKDSAKELVGRAKALHEHIGLSVVNHLHGLRDRLELHGIVNHGELGYIQPVVGTDGGYLGSVAHQGHTHEALLNGLVCGLDGMLINTPGHNHTLADTFGLKGLEYVVKILDHILYSSIVDTIFMVSLAMTSSSSVGIRATLTVESGVEMIVSDRAASLTSASTLTPI